MKNCVLVCLLVSGLSAVVGCGPSTSHLPKTVPAAGIVTLDGKPVDGAQVILVPAKESATGAFGTCKGLTATIPNSGTSDIKLELSSK